MQYLNKAVLILKYSRASLGTAMFSYGSFIWDVVHCDVVHCDKTCLYNSTNTTTKTSIRKLSSHQIDVSEEIGVHDSEAILPLH